MEVLIDKGRGIFGDAAEPFEATLTVEDNAVCWETGVSADAEIHRRVDDVKAEGKSVVQIAETLGMKKSAVQRSIEKRRAIGVG